MTVYVNGITIDGFRGVRRGTVDGFSDFTVLVGRNGAGKSTVLEALYLASAWLQPNDPIRGLSKYDYLVRRRGGRGSWDASRYVLWHLMDTERDIVIGLNLGKVATKFILHYPTPPLWLWIGDLNEALAYRLRVEGIRKCSLLRFEDGLAVFSGYPPPTALVNVRKDIVIEWVKAVFPNLLEVLGDTILIDNYLLSRPDVIENYSWPKVLAKRLDRAVVEMLKEEFEVEAEGLTYAPVGMSNVLMLQLRNTSVRIDDLGDGARLATLMMMVMLASKPKLLLIEEPETRMHPRGLKILTETLLRAAKNFNTQVIASTHSLEFVRIGLEAAKSLGIGASLIHLERSVDGTLIARRLSKPDVDLLTDLGVDPRFLDLF